MRACGSSYALCTFFTFSKRERTQIDSRRTELYGLAIALHVGFLRMTSRPLDSYRQIPTILWRHLGRQLDVQPPDVGTLRSIYDGNFKTLSDHQGFAKAIVNFRSRSLKTSKPIDCDAPFLKPIRAASYQRSSSKLTAQRASAGSCLGANVDRGSNCSWCIRLYWRTAPRSRHRISPGWSLRFRRPPSAR